jgi:hypothetical protein
MTGLQNRSQIDRKLITDNQPEVPPKASEPDQTKATEFDRKNQPEEGGGEITQLAIDSLEEPISPNERSQIFRCLGAITGVLWNDDFSVGTTKKKLAALRQEFGPAIYDAACETLSDEDKADLEALRRQR